MWARSTGAFIGSLGIMGAVGLTCGLSAGCGPASGSGGVQGSAGAGCYPNGTCSSGLMCMSGTCVTGDGPSVSRGVNAPATFLMTQTCLSGNQPTASLQISLSGATVSGVRTSSSDGNDFNYTGTISADCTSVTGTSPDWSATVFGGGPAAGGGCLLGDVWAERESDCVAGWTNTESAIAPTADTATFLMTQTCESGNSPTATMQISLSGDRIFVIRSASSDGNDFDYVGTMSPSCTSAAGSPSWSATITGGGLSGEGCSLGAVWRELESDCVAVWTSES